MNTKNKTVLLVDDDADFLYQTELRLKQEGYTVITADGEEAAETVLQETRPDIAVIDLMMERMDGGFTLAYHIKKIDNNIPVVMISGVTGETGISFDAATDEERNWVKADVFMAKPVRFEQLIRTIKKLAG